MKKLCMAVILLLTFMLNGCNDVMQGNKPPEVYVVIHDEKYESKLGTYCWKEKCADTIGPVELMNDKEPIQVQAGARITIEMEYTPKPDEVYLTQIANMEETEIGIQDNHFTAPSEKGIYHYAYSVWWLDEKQKNVSRGDAFYAFVIEVN